MIYQNRCNVYTGNSLFTLSFRLAVLSTRVDSIIHFTISIVISWQSLVLLSLLTPPSSTSNFTHSSIKWRERCFLSFYYVFLVVHRYNLCRYRRPLQFNLIQIRIFYHLQVQKYLILLKYRKQRLAKFDLSMVFGLSSEIRIMELILDWIRNGSIRIFLASKQVHLL